MRASLAAIILLFTLCSPAQVDSVYYGTDSVVKKEPRKRLRDQAWFDKVTFGGNFQAWLGNPSFVFISPHIGYEPVKNLNIGIGGIYNYLSVNYGYTRYRQSIFGSHSFMRYTIAQSYFVQTQLDFLRQPDWFTPDVNDRTWVEYLLVGGGFRQSISPNAAIITSIMYNLTPHPLSIYPGRVIVQFGFTAGF